MTGLTRPTSGMPVTESARKIVVTGSSSGIGRAVAQRLASVGCDLIVHGCNNQDGAQQTAEAVRRFGRQAEIVMGDLATEAGRDVLLNTCASSESPVSGWVHCAGVDVLTTKLREADFCEKFDALWQVDVRGTMLLARSAAEQMLARPAPNPSMVFIGWDQANRGMEGDAGQMFGPIKAAVTSFALNLAQEISPEIRVNVVAPGWIRTAWGHNTDAHWDQRARASSLMDRWGSPEDVAAAVEYFLSPHAQFVTGQVLDVNGGWNRTWSRYP